VIEVGPGVTRFKAGDRVAGCFFQDWSDGGISATAMASALGGPIDGILAQRFLLREAGAVHVPGHMSFEEAATLPCAGLTAWNCLLEQGGLKAGKTALFLGTGGVSIFGLQIAKMIGARAIVTSSSNEKLERARSLGADELINYRQTPEWEARVMELTDGNGVDVTRNHQLDRRSHRRRHQPDRGDAQIDPPAGSLRRQPAHVRRHERGIHPQPAAPGYRPGV
jgi:NADPH:quinone reductase-like Zn-dependent oxidoreductase